MNGKWSAALADTIMNRYPDPDSFPYKSWSYPQGFMLWGMAQLWEKTGDRKYFDYVLKYADGHVDEEGNIRGFLGNSLDDIMAGSVLVWAYHETGLIKYRLACERIRSVFDRYPRLMDGGFWHADWCPEEMWIDGLFMGLMFLTKYGRFVSDDQWCFDEAARQLGLGIWHCRAGDTGLLVHAWSQNRKAPWAHPQTGRSPEVWSEGLGWYALILVETLEILPADHPSRIQVEGQLALLLESLKDAQDKQTGLWYQVVDKGDAPGNWHDTSGSAMFTYAVEKAIRLGIADRSVYGPVAEAGYTGIVSKARVNGDGHVDILDACDGLGVQDSYSAYIAFPKTINAKEAVGAFLWASGICEYP